MAGAQGPDSFDCWGFVRYVLKHEYGHDVPQVNVNPECLRDVLHAFRTDLAFTAFVEVPYPRGGDVVLMRQAKIPFMPAYGLMLMAVACCIACVVMVSSFKI